MIDKLEARLIKEFFGIDCLMKLEPYFDVIQQKNSRETVRLREIGVSTFHRVVEFYKFEAKEREKEFWDELGFIETWPDVNVPLIMSKVNMGYFLLDYVTDIDINYEIKDKHLFVLNDVLSEKNRYNMVLKQICLMLFVSDFNADTSFREISNNFAWSKIMREISKIW